MTAAQFLLVQPNSKQYLQSLAPKGVDSLKQLYSTTVPRQAELTNLCLTPECLAAMGQEQAGNKQLNKDIKDAAKAEKWLVQ